MMEWNPARLGASTSSSDPSSIQSDGEVDRQLSAVARQLEGQLAWPTLALAVAVLTGFCGVTTLELYEILPRWAAIWLNTIAAIAAFTPLHEAVHHSVSGGATTRRWLDTVVGHLCGIVCLLEFGMFRRLHLAHHRFANVAGADPDCQLNQTRFGAVVIGCLTIIPSYLATDMRRVMAHGRTGARSDRATSWPLLGQVLKTAVFYAVPVSLLFTGFGFDVLTLWVIPAILGMACVSLGHWTLHVPCESTERFTSARTIHADGLLGVGLRTLYYGLNDHLVHHLFPRIPFYLQNKAFRLMRPALEHKGSEIVTLGAGHGRSPSG
jgi:beta-carotene hydroxylase